VALSLESPPPAVNRHRIPVEPGLSSTLARTPATLEPWTGQRPSGRLAWMECAPTLAGSSHDGEDGVQLGSGRRIGLTSNGFWQPVPLKGAQRDGEFSVIYADADRITDGAQRTRHVVH